MVQPPQGWVGDLAATGGCEDVVWELTGELYGKRIATSGWANFFAQVLRDFGLEQHQATPWVFKDSSRQLYLEVHMDDGHGCAPSE